MRDFYFDKVYKYFNDCYIEVEEDYLREYLEENYGLSEIARIYSEALLKEIAEVFIIHESLSGIFMSRPESLNELVYSDGVVVGDLCVSSDGQTMVFHKRLGSTIPDWLNSEIYDRVGDYNNG